MKVALLLVLARNTTKLTLLYGRKRLPNISCVGLHLGATDSQDGIVNVPQWEENTWVSISTFTVVEWISYSHIMNVR